MRPVRLGRPLAASLLLGGFVALGAAAVGSAWADLAAATEERDAQADLLARSVDAGRRLRLAAPGADAADPFIAAESDTQAAARLDAIVRAAASEAGCALLSSQAEAKLPDPARTDDGGLGTRVEDHAVIEGGNDQIQALLIRLETGAPAVRVASLELVPADEADGGGSPAPRLRLTATFAAYRRGAGS